MSSVTPAGSWAVIQYSKPIRKKNSERLHNVRAITLKLDHPLPRRRLSLTEVEERALAGDRRQRAVEVVWRRR